MFPKTHKKKKKTKNAFFKFDYTGNKKKYKNKKIPNNRMR